MFYKHLLVVLFGLAHFEVTSTNSVKKIVTLYRGNQDAVENNGCVADFCNHEYGLSCHSDGNCCRCQCLQDRPNYVVSKGLCLSNSDLGIDTNANCQYSLKAPQTPIASLKLTDQSNGSHGIYGDSSAGNYATCNHTLKITHWHYLNAHGKWIRGNPNVFSVKHELNTVGKEKNRYRLTKLQWNEKLNKKYAGVIIKVSISCGSKVIGCILIKSDGKKAFDTTLVTPTTTQTTTPLPRITTNIDILNPTTAEQNNNDGNSNKQKQGDGKKGKTSGNSSNAALAPTLGAVFGLLFVIALASVAVILYRRRQKRKNEKPWRNPETDSVANLDDYAEPIYAEVNKSDGFGHDNPVYCDPALDESNRRTAQLGPLPAIPGTETAYQPLNDLTRKAQDSDPKDYDNPIDGVQPSEDYDNPPVGSLDSGKEPSDYDNPPAQGTSENTSDYDNPPPSEDGDNEKIDYDVPKSQTADHSDGDNQESVDTQF